MFLGKDSQIAAYKKKAMRGTMILLAWSMQDDH